MPPMRARSSGGAGGSCHDWCTAEAPACCSSELRCVGSVPGCRLDVLAEQVSQPQSYADLQEKIVALSGAVAGQHAADRSRARRRRAAADGAVRDVAERRSLDRVCRAEKLEFHPFRVSCDDQELFVGVGYPIHGAAAIEAPVLHVEQEDGAVTLRIGAWQGVGSSAWVAAEWSDSCAHGWSRPS